MLRGKEGETIATMQVERLKLNGLSYRSENILFFMNKKEKTLEYRLCDSSNTMVYKFLIKKEEIRKVKINPNNITIDFKTLTIWEPFEENGWKKKAVLHNRTISCQIKLTEEEMAMNIKKIAEMKERKRKREENLEAREDEELTIWFGTKDSSGVTVANDYIYSIFHSIFYFSFLPSGFLKNNQNPRFEWKINFIFAYHSAKLLFWYNICDCTCLFCWFSTVERNLWENLDFTKQRRT